MLIDLKMSTLPPSTNVVSREFDVHTNLMTLHRLNFVLEDFRDGHFDLMLSLIWCH